MCSGVWPGVCMTVDGDVAEFQHVAVLDALGMGSRHRRSSNSTYSAPAASRERAPGRDMVGMDMRIDHVEDAHARRRGRLEIGRDVADGIDDGRGRLAAAAEEVGGGDGIGMKKLSQDHGASSVARSRHHPPAQHAPELDRAGDGCHSIILLNDVTWPRSAMSIRNPKQALYAQFAIVAKALGHPQRLELLEQLAQGPRSVDVLPTKVGLPIANASQHLQQFRRAGLVTAERDGKFVNYSLADDTRADAARSLCGPSRSATSPRSTASCAAISTIATAWSL